MIRILIVEDEKPIADLLEMSLTAAGYTRLPHERHRGGGRGGRAALRPYFAGRDAAGIDGFELMEYLPPGIR